MKTTDLEAFGKYGGLKINEYADVQLKYKAMWTEFNTLFKIIIDALQLEGIQVTEVKKGLWQNSGYFARYFWNRFYLSFQEKGTLLLYLNFSEQGLRAGIGLNDSSQTSLESEQSDAIYAAIVKAVKSAFIQTRFVVADFGNNAGVKPVSDLEAGVEDWVDIYKRLILPYEQVYQLFYTQPVNSKREKMQSLNTILYGPPGTGKTFNTVDLAWQVLNVGDTNESTRPGSIQELKARYPGQVEFVTFHQSFSYEDFVEGIQAKTQDGRITYKVEDGVFKKICIVAQHSRLKKSDGVQDFDFSLIYDQLLQSFREKLPYKIFTKSNKPLLIKAVSEQDSLHIYHEDSEVMHIVGRKRLKKLYESFSTIDTLNSVSNINNEFKEVIGGSNSSAYWAALNKVLHFKQEMSEQKGSSEVEQDSVYLTIEQKKKQLQDVDEADLGIGSPHVLIIDEINRGNISRIFGELITLIEPSKRAGNDEAIEVTLTYSKELFSVPNNLYIIGTMNTADRSLALMDTALRRRFDFIEMMPQPDLVTEDLEGVDVRKMLQVMNQRIEALYDREHTLGHAFLMKVESLADLRHAFKNKILPLLEEYFYDDWQKIRWVLGASADNFYVPQSFSHLFSGDDANIENKFLRNNLDDLDDEAFVAIYQS